MQLHKRLPEGAEEKAERRSSFVHASVWHVIMLHNRTRIRKVWPATLVHAFSPTNNKENIHTNTAQKKGKNL